MATNKKNRSNYSCQTWECHAKTAETVAVICTRRGQGDLIFTCYVLELLFVSWENAFSKCQLPTIYVSQDKDLETCSSWGSFWRSNPINPLTIWVKTKNPNEKLVKRRKELNQLNKSNPLILKGNHKRHIKLEKKNYVTQASLSFQVGSMAGKVWTLILPFHIGSSERFIREIQNTKMSKRE